MGVADKTCDSANHMSYLTCCKANSRARTRIICPRIICRTSSLWTRHICCMCNLSITLIRLQTPSDSKQQTVIGSIKVILHAGGMQPYGVDPAFNAYSSLYRADSFQRRWQFFNSSANSPELSATGAPFAFFPRRSPGYNDGFPVFFPVCVQPFSLCVQCLTCMHVFMWHHAHPRAFFSLCASSRMHACMHVCMWNHAPPPH
jgi:hypothetical protein